MRNLDGLLSNNRAWAQRVTAEDLQFFRRLAEQQAPDILWIGCSDSRVPATQIVDLLPGEIFVHRNVANLVVHSDLSCLSALQFAVDVLEVQHIVVRGHYGCSGVAAAVRRERHGLIDNWLRHVQDISNIYRTLSNAATLEFDKSRMLTELNVIRIGVQRPLTSGENQGYLDVASDNCWPNVFVQRSRGPAVTPSLRRQGSEVRILSGAPYFSKSYVVSQLGE